jgi:hypothetical protein
MPTIGGPKNVTHMEPKAPNYAHAKGINTLESDPKNGHSISFRADYQSLEINWRGGTNVPTDSPAGGPYGVFVDGEKVDLGKAQRYNSDGDDSQAFAEKWISIPKGRGEASIEIREGDEVVAKVTVDRQGMMKQVALGIADFRDQANIFAGMDDGFLGAMQTEDAGGLAKRAGVHLIKGLTPDMMIQGFAGGLGIEKSIPKALGGAAMGLGADVVEAAFQGIAALTNGVGAVWKAIT